MKNLAIIPARGGSKRIPRKNIKDFLGKPIISYSIDSAIDAALFDTVLVSTDDTEIAEIATQYGAEVPFLRSKKNSDDFATTLDVVREVVEDYRIRETSFDNICVIYPTAPFITKERIIEGYKNLDHGNASIPVTEFSYPVWRSFRLSKSKTIEYQWPEFEKRRSQDLEPLYHDAGQWYWIKLSQVNSSLIPKRTIPVILKNIEVQDIDTLEDWKLAELKYEYLQSLK